MMWALLFYCIYDWCIIFERSLWGFIQWFIFYFLQLIVIEYTPNISLFAEIYSCLFSSWFICDIQWKRLYQIPVVGKWKQGRNEADDEAKDILRTCCGHVCQGNRLQHSWGVLDILWIANDCLFWLSRVVVLMRRFLLAMSLTSNLFLTLHLNSQPWLILSPDT